MTGEPGGLTTALWVLLLFMGLIQRFVDTAAMTFVQRHDSDALRLNLPVGCRMRLNGGSRSLPCPYLPTPPPPYLHTTTLRTAFPRPPATTHLLQHAHAAARTPPLPRLPLPTPHLHTTCHHTPPPPTSQPCPTPPTDSPVVIAVPRFYMPATVRTAVGRRRYPRLRCDGTATLDGLMCAPLLHIGPTPTPPPLPA